MKCPACQHNGTRVVDSRPVDELKSIRRRRECEECGYRFTTFEKVEEMPLIVVKKDGSREEFSREKVLRGLIRACEKRPVPLETLEELVFTIEKDLRRIGNAEVKSEQVGKWSWTDWRQLMKWLMSVSLPSIASSKTSMYL